MRARLPQTVKTYGVTIAVAVALVLASAVTLLAITSNRGAAVVTCDQVLKLRDANLTTVDLFETAVKEGWARRPPDEAVTAAERATANRFFEGQRAALRAVHCP